MTITKIGISEPHRPPLTGEGFENSEEHRRRLDEHAVAEYAGILRSSQAVVDQYRKDAAEQAVGMYPNDDEKARAQAERIFQEQLKTTTDLQEAHAIVESPKPYAGFTRQPTFGEQFEAHMRAGHEINDAIHLRDGLVEEAEATRIALQAKGPGWEVEWNGGMVRGQKDSKGHKFENLKDIYEEAEASANAIIAKKEAEAPALVISGNQYREYKLSQIHGEHNYDIGKHNHRMENGEVVVEIPRNSRIDVVRSSDELAVGDGGGGFEVWISPTDGRSFTPQKLKGLSAEEVANGKITFSAPGGHYDVHASPDEEVAVNFKGHGKLDIKSDIGVGKDTNKIFVNGKKWERPIYAEKPADIQKEARELAAIRKSSAEYRAAYNQPVRNGRGGGHTQAGGTAYTPRYPTVRSSQYNRGGRHASAVDPKHEELKAALEKSGGGLPPIVTGGHDVPSMAAAHDTGHGIHNAPTKTQDTSVSVPTA